MKTKHLVFLTNGSSFTIHTNSELLAGVAAAIFLTCAHGGGWDMSYVHKHEDENPETGKVSIEWSVQEKHADGAEGIVYHLIRLLNFFYNSPDIEVTATDEFKTMCNQRLTEHGKAVYFGNMK